MNIDNDILNNLLRCNKGIKLEFREDSDILDIYLNHKIILSIELEGKSIEENSNLIYYSIINLEGITLYIPKIYINDTYI